MASPISDEELPPDAFPGPKAFARWALRENRLALRPVLDGLQYTQNRVRAILFRSGPWQVELIAMAPNERVARHRHNRVSSVDVAIGGGGLIEINGRQRSANRGDPIQRLVSVPAGAWHSGNAGRHGGLYLSFQQWLDGKPGHIFEDWEAEHA